MTAVEATDRTNAGVVAAPSGAPSSVAAPKAIQLLLPVWGQRYIKQFLNTCLPTMLAPGNLPALAAALPCKFVFLTSSEDAEILREHPACRYLSSICDVDVRVIDDLITGDNHSTTITLAYAHAVKAAGEALLDTCFFFLISDYLMADGSLATVLDRVMAGARGVLAGNFQVVEEDAYKSFHATFDRGDTPEIVLRPRELVKWALPFLHPVTAGNSADFPLARSTQSNRLFWRVDEDTLLGRFYLMHMIAIWPEVSDFVIGSSCDYSFIPEMCPSDKVDVITDSDDYLVVEMQPGDHEGEYLRLGSKDPLAIAGSLGEWTTKRHRDNVRHSLVFHAADLPPSLPAVIQKSDEFIDAIDFRLSRLTPHPHRDHRYWIGAIVAHRLSVSRKLGQHVKISQIYREYGHVPWKQRFRDTLFGRPPDTRPWHPRWPDFAVLKGELRKVLTGPNRRLLIVSRAPFQFAEWLGGIADQTTCMETRRLQAITPDHYMALVGSFDGCLLVMGESEMRQSHILMKRIEPLLVAGGFVAASVFSGRSIATDEGFEKLLTRYCGKFLGLRTPVSSVRFVQMGPLRAVATRALLWLYRGALDDPTLYYPLGIVLVPFLLLACLVGNMFAFVFRRSTRSVSTPSSVWMLFRFASVSTSLPDLSPDPELYARADRYRTVAKPLRQPALAKQT
jgi:hypothetical protein